MKNKDQIAVIGAGVIGLTTSINLISKGYSVTIFCKDFNNQTSLSTAHAYWWPHKIGLSDEVKIWAAKSYSKYKELAENPESGVSFKDYLRFCIGEDDSLFALELFEDWKEINFNDYGVRADKAFLTRLPSVDTSRHLKFLSDEIKKNGGNFVEREIKSFDDLKNDFSTIINCSGLGAKKLASDDSVYPIRGQTVHVRSNQPSDNAIYIYRYSPSFSTITPFGSDLILAGITQANNYDLAPNRKDSVDIISHCAQFRPSLSNAVILEERVGLRPARPYVRLEKEEVSGDLKIIHNYGHGGSGFTLSWGCAENVALLL